MDQRKPWEMEEQTVSLSSLENWSRNPRESVGTDRLKEILTKRGQLIRLLLDGRDMKTVLGGNQRLKAMRELGWEFVGVTVVHPKDDKDAVELALENNDTFGKYVKGMLIELVKEYSIDTRINVDLRPTTIESILIKNDTVDQTPSESAYIEPPFSIMDGRKGLWQERKAQWKERIGYSGGSRDGIDTYSASAIPIHDRKLVETYMKKNGLTNVTEAIQQYIKEVGPLHTNEVSIFDPYLTEVMYTLFFDEGTSILDPFAGGHVRGAVAKMLGYTYTGYDIRKEQIDENYQMLQGLGITEGVDYVHNSLDLDPEIKEFDNIFTCPPYGDLEEYSKDENDLSNMEADEFTRRYTEIIKAGCRRLKRGGFSIYVVGDYRVGDKLVDLSGITTRAHEEGGLTLYNKLEYLTPIGSAMLRMNKIWGAGRKIVRIHQEILVYTDITATRKSPKLKDVNQAIKGTEEWQLKEQ